MVEQEIEKLQQLADMKNSKELFAETCKLYGPKSGDVGSIGSKDGSNIKERWGEPFWELLNQDAQVDEHAIERLPKPPTIIELAEPPTIDELEKASSMTKLEKAAGPDRSRVRFLRIVARNWGKRCWSFSDRCGIQNLFTKT